MNESVLDQAKNLKLSRGRGRPLASDPSGDELRELIITVAADAYAEYGYNNCSVQKILLAAGVSRPTFYRYFQDRYQVLDVVIERINNQLVAIAVEQVKTVKTLDQLIVAMVDGYFQWGARMGNLVGPVYREIYDVESPAQVHRLRILDEITELFKRTNAALGHPEPDLILIDAMLHIIEHTGHEAFWPTAKPEAEQKRRRDLIVRLLRAILHSEYSVDC